MKEYISQGPSHPFPLDNIGSMDLPLVPDSSRDDRTGSCLVIWSRMYDHIGGFNPYSDQR
jgi:hypothetical protein